MPAPAAAATHAELAHLIARGDRKRAAALLVRDHAPAVLSLCRAMVRDPRLAEDLSQDAFARAFGALDGFRGEASPRTWLLRIARNRCLDHLDRARRAPWTAGDDEPDDHAADEPPPYDLLARREDAERAMTALGESERALVVLHFGHGVGYPELADSFGLREGAVRMRISRALARMRAALAPIREVSESGYADFEAEAPTSIRGDRALAAGFEEGEPEDVAEDDACRVRRSAEEAPLDDLDLDDDFEETSLTPTRPLAGPEAPPTFGSLRDEVSPALLRHLEALASSL